MITIDNKKNIGITRGDNASFNLKVKQANNTYYQFKTSDLVYFNVKKNYADSTPIIRKIITFRNTTDTCTINLVSSDTNFGSLIAGERKYVYDISINETETVVGYDNDGAKYFIIYPEASNDE